MFCYKVRKGESVRSVAQKFRLPEAALARENETPFYEGQRVFVPVSVLRLEPEDPEVIKRLYGLGGEAILTRPDASIIIFM